MGNFLTHGFTYIDGTTNVNATNLHSLVDDAVLKPEAISALSAKNPVDGTEELLLNDGGVLKKATAQVLANFVFSLAVVPTGAIMDYAGTTAPSGWFFCYGQSLSRSTYSILFLAIGTTYGAVDGASFSLPDLRGCVTAGKDDMGGVNANRLSNWGGTNVNLGAFDGEATHTLTIAEMPSHTHGVVVLAPTGGIAGGSNYGISGTTGSTGGNGAHNTCQPTRIMNKIIKF
jgi:microcystin-dependent protein